MTNNPTPCPNAANHTPAPAGYVEWHEWAERMSRTHEHRRCGECGLWVIWVELSGNAGEVTADGAGQAARDEVE